MKWQGGHTHFCMEALYGYSLVSSRNGSKASVFDFLKFFPNSFSKQWHFRGGPPCWAAGCNCRADNSGIEQPQNLYKGALY
jgi:hypothetical protein